MNYQPHQQYRRLVECNSYHLECFLPTKPSKNPRLPKEFRIFWTARSRTCTQCPCRYVFLFKTNEPEIFMASRCYFGGCLLVFFFFPVVGQKMSTKHIQWKRWWKMLVLYKHHGDIYIRIQTISFFFKRKNHWIFASQASKLSVSPHFMA